MRTLRVTAAVTVALVVVARAGAQPAGHSPLKAANSRLPLYFIENRGICPNEVKFYVKGADKTLFFTKDGITFRLKGKDRSWVVRQEFVGANPDVRPRGADRQDTVFSYFKGPEKDWKTGLETFSKVVYEALWPGIDLVYQGTVNHLKYEFVVAPGEDPATIRFRYRGAAKVTATDTGGLEVQTPEGSFEDAPPLAWQVIDGKKRPVEVEYELSEGAGEIAFRVGDYDRSTPLVLDPALLVYCGYIGGSSDDQGIAIAVDAFGSAYVVGHTMSDETTFPVRVGPDLSYNGASQSGGDAFVAKVNASGTALLYCGYLGGSSVESAHGVAVDALGNAYVTGITNSDEKTFPVRVGPDLTHNGGYFDAFVAKVNPAGTALVYCGYIGGAGPDDGAHVAVDASGSAYVTGQTASNQSTFPVKIGPDLTYNGGDDGFVAKVNSLGSGLDYCGYVGGTGLELAMGVDVDASGHAYVCGLTGSDQRSFPVKVGPDLTYNDVGGGSPWTKTDAFVAKVSAGGSGFVYCGYIGGAWVDAAYAVAVDASGSAYVTGATQSDEKSFPVKVGPDLSYNGVSPNGDDAFVAKVDASGAGLVYCGYIGGYDMDSGWDIDVDTTGNAYVVGVTMSNEQSFPVLVGPDLTFNGAGNGDVFVTKVGASGRGLVYSGYIGGSGSDSGAGIAVDSAGAAYVTGRTTSDEKTFPVVVGPRLTHASPSLYDGDAFVAKISLTHLSGTGTPRPGGVIRFALTANDDAGLPYQVASSLGLGPIAVDTRKIDLSPDALLLVSVGGLLPSVFAGYPGVVDANGQAKAAIHVPNIPALIGLRLHSAFVTLSPAAPSGIKSISNTFSLSVAR